MAPSSASGAHRRSIRSTPFTFFWTEILMRLRPWLLAINHGYIFLLASLYVGLFTSLHFFWFPTFGTLTTENYYQHIIAQTEAATRFFFVVIPPMILAIFIMLWSEWKTKFRWVPIAWILG